MIVIRATVLLYTLVMLLLALFLAARADASPAGMLLAFGPRWWSVLPWALLLPASFAAGRRTVAVALAGTVITALGVAHVELPARGPTGAARDIRLVTYNTDISASLADRLRQDIAAWDADIIVLQDCKTIVADSLRAIVRGAVMHGRFCFASRWPLVRLTDFAELSRTGDPRLAPYRDGVRFLVRTPYGELPVYSLHLPSPRHALAAARWLEPRALVPRLRESLRERGHASAAVSSVVPRTAGAFIVAGDFNLPYGSAILRRDWGDLTNAFAHAGTGFGHTMQAGIFPVRIDHVLVPSSLVPVGARVLSGYPSEHQPVVVDLSWRG
jgi:vancomycin resistance protein VanJ